MKKILALEEGPGFGGALMSLKCLLENSNHNGYYFHLITNYYQDYILAGGAVKDVKVLPRERLYGKDKFIEKSLRCILGKKAGPAAYLIDRCTYCNSYVNKIAKYIKEEQIDLVHLNNWPLLNDGGVFAAKKAKIPVVMHVRGMEYSSRLIAMIANKADYIIAISEFVQSQVLALGVPEYKISIIPNAVDVNSFVMNANGKLFRGLVGLPANQPVVGMAGCLVDWKGHKFFIEACAEVFKRSSAHGIVIGGAPDCDPSLENELKSYADQLGVLDRMHFVGHKKDIASAMDACDILVHASTRPEPFGRVIIEAMALGKPVVATSPGGPSEIIDDMIDGLLIPASDSLAMADAIASLLGSVELCNKLGKNARKKAVAIYDVESYVNKITSVYDHVLNVVR